MDKVTALAVTAVAAILVGGFVAITLSHNPTQDYLILLGGPAVSGLLGALILKRTTAVQQDLATVKEATNGALTGALTDIKDTLATASVERQDIAVTLMGSNDGPGPRHNAPQVTGTGPAVPPTTQ
jgi:hypothetical protein